MALYVTLCDVFDTPREPAVDSQIMSARGLKYGLATQNQALSVTGRRSLMSSAPKTSW